MHVPCLRLTCCWGWGVRCRLSAGCGRLVWLGLALRVNASSNGVPVTGALPIRLPLPVAPPRPQVLFLLSVAFSCGASVGCYIRRLICGVRLRLVRRGAPRGCSLRSASLCPPSTTACCVVLLSGQPSAPCWRSRRRRRRPPSLGAALDAARAVRAVRVAWMRSRRASCAFK